MVNHGTSESLQANSGVGDGTGPVAAYYAMRVNVTELSGKHDLDTDLEKEEGVGSG